MKQFLSENNKKYIAVVLVVAAVVGFMKFLLPLILPFLLAICLYYLMSPFINKAEKKLGMSGGICAALILLIVVLICAVLTWLLASWFCRELCSLFRNMDQVEDCMCAFTEKCCTVIQDKLGINASYMQNFMMSDSRFFSENMKNQILPRLMSHSVSYARALGKAAAFFAITLIATFFLIKDLGNISRDLKKSRLCKTIFEIGTSVGKMIGGYLRAQGIILLTICIVSAAGLSLLRIENGIMAGILAGIMDALPFIGTGIVLVPVALWQVIQGRLWRALFCLIIYVACILIRESLEPRLLGKHMGIYPVLILFTIYVGIKLYGISGVALGPLSFLVIREILNKTPYFSGFVESDG